MDILGIVVVVVFALPALGMLVTMLAGGCLFLGRCLSAGGAAVLHGTLDILPGEWHAVRRVLRALLELDPVAGRFEAEPEG